MLPACSSRGNHQIVHSAPVLVDATAPPVQLIPFPRVIPEVTVNTSAGGVDQYLIIGNRLSPAWNATTSTTTPLLDPESGPCETWWEFYQVTHDGVNGTELLVRLKGPYASSSSFAQVILHSAADHLTHNAQYVYKVRFRNRAGSSASIISEYMIFDSTPPVAGAPIMHPTLVSDRPTNDFVGQWWLPPHSSRWGGYRSFVWIGSATTHVDLWLGSGNDIVCQDPESGIHAVMFSVGTKRGWSDLASRREIANTGGNITVRVDWPLRAHALPHFLAITCRNGAAVERAARAAAVFKIDRTPPQCTEALALLGEGDHIEVQSVSNRLKISGVNGALWDPETGISRVEFTLEDRLAMVDPDSGAFIEIGHLPDQPLPALNMTNITLFNYFYAQDLQLEHLHLYRVRVNAWNGVGLNTTCRTSAVLVDQTPPLNGTIRMVHSWASGLLDDAPTELFQSSTAAIRLAVRDFADPDSGLASYRIQIIRDDGWILARETTISIVPRVAFPARLAHNDAFHVWLKAYNRADAFQQTRSALITVDATPPVIDFVNDWYVGDSEIQYVGKANLTVVTLFKARDVESGIRSAHWYIGTYPGINNVLDRTPVDVRLGGAAQYLEGLLDNVYYYATLEVENGAGSFTFKSSDGFRVDLSPPSCGNVYDGPSFDREFVGPTMVRPWTAHASMLTISVHRQAQPRACVCADGWVESLRCVVGERVYECCASLFPQHPPPPTRAHPHAVTSRCPTAALHLATPLDLAPHPRSTTSSGPMTRAFA